MPPSVRVTGTRTSEVVRGDYFDMGRILVARTYSARISRGMSRNEGEGADLRSTRRPCWRGCRSRGSTARLPRASDSAARNDSTGSSEPVQPILACLIERFYRTLKYERARRTGEDPPAHLQRDPAPPEPRSGHADVRAPADPNLFEVEECPEELTRNTVHRSLRRSTLDRGAGRGIVSARGRSPTQRRCGCR